MEDYIPRKEAIIAVCRARLPDTTEDGIPIANGKRSVTDCVRRIKEIPAADVRPVRRGKWLNGNDNPRTYGRIRAMCGRCGAFALAEMVNAGSYKEHLSNFCPNCGADMREES